MVVWYVHGSSVGGLTQVAIILWKEKWPQQGGKFPQGHPCLGNAAQFQEFMERGYGADPFPEGDGVSLNPQKGQSDEQVVKDIEECFGWEVRRVFHD